MPQTWIDLPGGFGLLGGHLYFVHTENLQGSFIVRPVSYFSNFQQWELLVPKPRGPRKTYCMFDTNGEIIHYALGRWVDHIKYGTSDPKHNATPKVLNEDQMRLILKLQVLQKKALGKHPIEPAQNPTLE